MVHKVEQNEENKGNIFSEGVKGWGMLFSVFKKKKKDEPQQNQQQNNGQNPQQVQGNNL